MAAYPAALKIGEGSGMGQKDDLVVDRAVNGSARARSYFVSRKREFVVRHPFATLAERDALLGFYDANRIAQVTLLWMDGVTYTCIFAAAPRTDPVLGGAWTLESKLVEV